MIGPERGKPVGAFYSADGNINPTGFAFLKNIVILKFDKPHLEVHENWQVDKRSTESKNWYACKYKGFRGSKNSWVPAKKKHFCIQVLFYLKSLFQM